MKDTSQSMMNRFQKMIMARSSLERLLMGCSMYDTARRIAESSIRNRNPLILSAAMKKEIFLRFYGKDFSESNKKRILSVLEKT